MCAKGTPAPTETSGEPTINNFTFQLDQSTYSDDGECRRHLIVSIKAPSAAREEGRPPLDLALVIDTSGSMHGQPLAYAKRAAAGVVECLQAEDRLTLVTFGWDVRVLFSDLSMDGSNKAHALGTIGLLGIGGSTYLSGGWLAAGASLAESAGQAPGRHRQIILLSDGFANVGVVEPDLLASGARSLLDRGVSTSCVGVGDGYSTVQLDAIADFGGGRVHDAELPEEIVEVVSGELGGLSEVTVQAAELELVMPDGVTGRDLSGGPTTREGDTLVCHIGAIRGGAERNLVLRLDLSGPATLSEDLTIAGQLRWTEPGSKERKSEALSLTLDRAVGCPAPVTQSNLRAVVSAWQAGLTRLITNLNREGRFDEILQLRFTELRWLEAYTEGHPELRLALRRMHQLLQRASSPMEERSRKDMHMMMKKGIRAEPEHRAKYMHMDLANDFASAEAELDRILRED